MTEACIGNSAATLTVVPLVLIGVFSWLWMNPKEDWRFFALGIALFFVPFLLFLATDIFVHVSYKTGVVLLTASCVSLGVATIV